MFNKYGKNYFNKTTEKGTKESGFHKKFVENEGIILKNLVICDIGCARGLFIKKLIDKNICYGYDISAYAIHECRKKFPKIKKSFRLLDLNKSSINNPNLKFDLITMFDVIEHLDNYIYFKEIIINNLKSGGYLVITTPNANAALRFLSKKRSTGEIDNTHKNLFTPYTLDFFLRRVGLRRTVLFTPYSFYFKDNLITKNILLGGQIFGIYTK